MHEIVQAHRRHIIESMHHFGRRKAEMAPDDIGIGLSADAEMYRLEAIVRWLDAADIRPKHYLAAGNVPPREGVHSPHPSSSSCLPNRGRIRNCFGVRAVAARVSKSGKQRRRQRSKYAR